MNTDPGALPLFHSLAPVEAGSQTSARVGPSLATLW